MKVDNSMFKIIYILVYTSLNLSWRRVDASSGNLVDTNGYIVYCPCMGKFLY